MKRGILIAFDGIDGAGKTTQANLLAQAIRQAGVEVLQSKEPTNGKWGQALRASAQAGRLSLEKELEYFTLDRKDHLEILIKPALSDGKVVILDRYYYSTVAYQSSRGADAKDILAQMKSFALVPDATYIIDLEVEDALHRIRNVRGEIPNHFEQTDSLRKAREYFNALTASEKEVVKVDGRNLIEPTHQAILKHFTDGPLKDRLCAKPYESDCGFCGLRMANSCEWWTTLPSIKPVTSIPGILAAA